MTEEIEAIAKRLVVGHKRDGRSIYNPVTGGVRWEDNAVFLPDLVPHNIKYFVLRVHEAGAILRHGQSI